VKVIKIKREFVGNFMTVSKQIVSDKSISLRARGFFLTVMSLGPRWNYTIAGLSALHPGGRDQVYNSLNELIKHNYVAREPLREEGKIIEWIYYFDEFGDASSVLTAIQEVAENPTNSPLPEKQHKAMPDMAKPQEANTTQLIPNLRSSINSEGIAICSNCDGTGRYRGTLETWPCERCKPVDHKAWMKSRGKI
jgi:hypothetical protein